MNPMKTDGNKLLNKKKSKPNYKLYLKRGIQLLFFLFYPALFSTAFSGAKYIAGQIGKGESIELNSFVLTLILLLGSTILFGRLFCGFACAFGSLGDFIYGISLRLQKKYKRKIPRLPLPILRGLQSVKYILLIGLLASCYFGVNQKLQGTSPWDVFSTITSLQLPKSSYLLGSIFLGLILIGMATVERFFCQFLCPMGGLFAIMPILPWSLLKRDRPQCIKGCAACEKICPAALKVDGDSFTSGECFRCGRCQQICPKKNISVIKSPL